MRTQRGFTLIELVIVITVIGILAALATSQYSRYVLRAHRAEAWTAMLQIQSAEEKYYMQNSTYTANLTAAPPTGLGLSLNSSGGNYATLSNYYSITVATAACAAGSATLCSYTATATAQGNQAKDVAACLVYTVNSLGQRTPLDTTNCWH